MPLEIRTLGADDVAMMRAMLALFGEAFEDRDGVPAVNLYSKLGKRENVPHFDIPPTPINP